MSTYRCKWCKDTGVYVGLGFNGTHPCLECLPEPQTLPATAQAACVHRWEPRRDVCTNCGITREQTRGPDQCPTAGNMYGLDDLEIAQGAAMDTVAEHFGFTRHVRPDGWLESDAELRDRIKTDMLGPRWETRHSSDGSAVRIKRW